MQNSSIKIQREHCANNLKTLHQQGISVIPLNGKRPSFSIRWKQYQHVLAPIEQIEQWSQQNPTSYGIICGRISRGLFVVDFDCPDLYNKFQQEFPDLANTYTVQTRRGFHVYFRSDMPIPGRHFKNCDIKGEGGYVVGAGSVIDGVSYQVSQTGEIIKLTYDQYQTVLRWLNPTTENLIIPDPKKEPLQRNLIQQYQILVSQGRNNALYQVARDAMKQGIALAETKAQLVIHHVKALPSNHHPPETYTERMKEAITTIQSAYSKKCIQNTDGQIPNQIRETLLKKQGSTITARVLDTIYMQHSNTQKWITLKQLTQLCQKAHISKKSLIQVLTGYLGKVNGKRIFKQFRYQDYQNQIESFVSQGDNPTPNVRVGRRTQFIYRIPTIEELCQILRVKGGVSDRLKPQDLFSAGAYRRALHRELIRRLSPVIRVDWYANRLGVNRRTIFRYNLQIGVIRRPMIRKRSLKRELICGLPIQTELEGQGFTPGTWIESASGKRYPALQSVAVKLLHLNPDNLWLCQQLPTQYSLADHVFNEQVELPDHLKHRGHLLTYANIHEVLPPDWATDKYDLGGYLAVYTGHEWSFRPPLRVIAYQLTKQYEDGMVYFIRPLKPE